MRREKCRSGLSWLLLPAVAAAVLLCFLTGLSDLERGRTVEERQQLETAIRRSCAACYAAEGAYPPNLAVLEARYGLRIDRERYTVIYDLSASNLMPDITILETGI